MATASITTNAVTGIDVPAGDHVLEIYGTWDSATATIRHKGSSIPFSGLGSLTATPGNASIITTGGESVEVVTLGGGGSLALTVRVNRSTPRV